MADPIDVLMEEHRVIEKVLDALEAAAGKEVPFAFYGKALDFFAAFADGCHHAKEEDRLFPELEKKGVPRAGGPIGVMCHEHTLGRGHVKRMREYLRQENRSGLRRESLEYAALLRAHIQKEDNVLFQIARDVLDAGEMGRLSEAFAEAEAGPVCDRRYRKLADDLKAEAGVA